MPFAANEGKLEAAPPAPSCNQSSSFGAVQPTSSETGFMDLWLTGPAHPNMGRRHTLASTSRRHVQSSLNFESDILSRAADEVLHAAARLSPRRASAPAKSTLDDAHVKSLLQRIDEDHPMSRSRGAECALSQNLYECALDDAFRDSSANGYGSATSCCSSSSCCSSPSSSCGSQRRSHSSFKGYMVSLSEGLNGQTVPVAHQDVHSVLDSGGALHLMGGRPSPSLSSDTRQLSEQDEQLLWRWRQAGDELSMEVPRNVWGCTSGGQSHENEDHESSHVPLDVVVACGDKPYAKKHAQPQLATSGKERISQDSPLFFPLEPPSPNSDPAPRLSTSLPHSVLHQQPSLRQPPSLPTQMVPALSSHQQLNQHAPHFMGPPHAGQDNAAQLQLQVQLLQLQMQQMRQQQLQMHHMGPVSGVAFPSAHVPSLLGYPPVVPILPAQLQAQPPPLPAAPAQPQSRSVGAGSLPSYGFCSAQTTAACMQSGFSSQAPGGSVLPASASHTRGPRSGVHDTNSVADVKAGAVRAGGGALTGSFWGHLVALAKDPKGSRQLQAQLPRMADQQLARAAEELSPHLYELSRHTFGNYLVSKLASIPQMYAPLTRALKGNVVDLLQHAQGSRVVQAALASLPPAAAMELTSELDGRILECAMDTHGSWGVCIAFKHTRASFILKQMSKHMYALSTQQHGCRVVQSVLQAASSAHLDLSLPVSAILGGEIEYLAMHPFGNYAVQVSLRHCDEKQRLQLLDALLPRLLQLSTSKHGSNVAETVLMLADEAQISRASEQIFGNGPECRSALQQLVEHPFGNYVLQTLLRRMEPEQRSLAAVSVRAVTTPSNYGRSVLARVGEDDDIGEETAHSTSGAAFASSHVAMLIGSSGILDEVGRSC